MYTWMNNRPLVMGRDRSMRKVLITDCDLSVDGAVGDD